MPAVRILLDGLTDSGRIYRAGDVEEAPSARLLALAGGEMLSGQVVAEFDGKVILREGTTFTPSGTLSVARSDRKKQ